MPDYTTTSAAAELGVSRRQVIKLINQGRLLAVRFGRDWSVDGASVEAYKASRRKAGRPRKDKTMEYPLSSSQEARIRFDDLCYRQASEDVKSYVDAGGDLSDFDLDAYWIMFEVAFNPGYDDADEAHARFMDQYRKVLAEYR